MRISLCGGQIHILDSTDGQLIPIICGLNDRQLFDTNGKVYVSLPDLPAKEWSELQPFLLSLGDLELMRSPQLIEDCF